MTWREIVERIEAYGVTKDTVIRWADVGWDTEDESDSYYYTAPPLSSSDAE